MNVRCPGCGGAVALAVGDTRLACAGCGLAAPVSRIGTAPGGSTTGALLVTLEADLTGSVLGGHTIVERIGAGGMGTVYRASGETTDVAIKVLRPGLGIDRSAALARFAREAEALRRLDHPRVVRLLDHGEAAGVAYIVTELVRGRDLAATLADGRMSLEQIVDIFGQVCDGVSAAHAAGIVHRDLKPANILVSDGGMVKIADFGLAQLGPDAAVTTLTRTNVAMGTFHYLAPEQRKDAHGIDHRADIWALGVILYEMLTGELPLGSFAPPSSQGPAGCDRRADAVVRRALAPDPADRFASVAELGGAVRALVTRHTRQRRLVLAAAAVLAIGGGGAFAMQRINDDKPGSVAAIEARSAESIDASSAVASAIVDARVVELDASSVVASADAGVAADAAIVTVAAAPPKPPRKPIKTTTSVGKPPVKRVKGGKSKAQGSGAELADEPASIGDGGKVVAAPAVCRSAQRCCAAVSGKAANCNSHLQSDAATCEAALVELRGLAKNKKQQFLCR